MATYNSNRAPIHGHPVMQGCMGLGGPWDADGYTVDDVRHAEATLHTALEAGITSFDHADIYSRGKSELVFGEVLKRNPSLRKKIFIQSKCAIRPAGSLKWPRWNPPLPHESGSPHMATYDVTRYDFSAAWILSSTDAILSRLGIDNLDRLLLHRPDPLMQLDEVVKAFTALKKAGKVANFGVSNFSVHQIKRLAHALEPEGIHLEANQIELSLLHHDAIEAGIMVNQRGWAGEPWKGEFDSSSGTAHAPTGTGSLDLASFCADFGVEVQAWGCLSQGKLSGRALSAYVHPTIQNTAKLVADLAEQKSVSKEAIVLSWLLRLPLGIRPVIGTTKPERIRACAQASATLLQRQEWYALYEAARGGSMP